MRTKPKLLNLITFNVHQIWPLCVDSKTECDGYLCPPSLQLLFRSIWFFLFTFFKATKNSIQISHWSLSSHDYNIICLDQCKEHRKKKNQYNPFKNNYTGHGYPRQLKHSETNLPQQWIRLFFINNNNNNIFVKIENKIKLLMEVNFEGKSFDLKWNNQFNFHAILLSSELNPDKIK